MASSLFGNSTQQQAAGNSIFGQMAAVKDFIGGDATAAYNRLKAQNPQFAEFAKKNAGKSPEQIAKENGIDISVVKKLFGDGR